MISLSASSAASTVLRPARWAWLPCAWRSKPPRSLGLPVMAHIAGGPPNIDDVLDLLRPGDLVTHCATGQDMSLVNGKNSLRPSAVRARERGVLFDVGHGSGGFSFAVAESMLAAGAPPDVISSDLHQRSLLGPGFDLPTCMSKFLAIGMSLEDVIRAVTTNPARSSREHRVGARGTLAVGEPADLAIFELEAGDFALYDTYLECRRADRFFVNRDTVVAGVHCPRWPRPRPPTGSRSRRPRGHCSDAVAPKPAARGPRSSPSRAITCASR